MRTSLDLSYEERAQRRPYDAGSKLVKGSYRTQNIFSNESSADFMAKYTKQVNDKFDFSIMAGGNILRNRYNKDETRADSLTYPGVYSFANAAGPLVSMPYNSKYAINSFYGLITAAYNKYLYLDLTACARTGTVYWQHLSVLPMQDFFYPSANLSFVLSDAMNLGSQIDFAKFRFSASSVGSGGTSPYLTAYNYETAGSLFSGGLQTPSVVG
jgi:hypothetical protein